MKGFRNGFSTRVFDKAIRVFDKRCSIRVLDKGIPDNSRTKRQKSSQMDRYSSTEGFG